MKKLTVLLALSLLLAACGVKSDLTKPDGDQTPAGHQDPSKPPQPIGR